MIYFYYLCKDFYQLFTEKCPFYIQVKKRIFQRPSCIRNSKGEIQRIGGAENSSIDRFMGTY